MMRVSPRFQMDQSAPQTSSSLATKIIELPKAGERNPDILAAEPTRRRTSSHP